MLCSEVPLILRGCEEAHPGYKPLLTFVVVQKRHNTRLFVKDPRDCDNRSGNGAPSAQQECPGPST